MLISDVFVFILHLCFHSSSGLSCHSGVAPGFQFLIDFTITEVNTSGHRAENDSCLTCVSISTEYFCQDKPKLTAKRAARSLVKSQPSSASTPLSLPAINSNK